MSKEELNSDNKTISYLLIWGIPALLVAMIGCGSETAAQEDQPTTPAKDAQSRALAEKATLKGHTGYVLSVSFSPDGKRIASASDDKTIRLWDVPP